MKNYAKCAISASITLAIMMTTISVNTDIYAQDPEIQRYEQSMKQYEADMKNQSKLVLDEQQLSMMTDYCIKHADRAAAGENVTNDLVLSGLLPANLGNMTCSAIQEINNQLGSSFSP
jgi:hypothetical protein